MRWLARRSSVPVCPPQAGTAGAGARDDDAPDSGGAPSAHGQLLTAAERFVTLFHAENPRAGSVAGRMRQILAEVAARGTYQHTPEELTFAARVAWRNSSRCIGRLYWRTLRVRDRRRVTAADQVAAECVAHLREATNAGRIRPVITVFA